MACPVRARHAPLRGMKRSTPQGSQPGQQSGEASYAGAGSWALRRFVPVKGAGGETLRPSSGATGGRPKWCYKYCSTTSEGSSNQQVRVAPYAGGGYPFREVALLLRAHFTDRLESRRMHALACEGLHGGPPEEHAAPICRCRHANSSRYESRSTVAFGCLCL